MALADFYMSKGDLDGAEREFGRAFNGFDAAIDRDHSFMQHTAKRLGAIYQHRMKLDAAELMYQRVYESYERTLGRDHWITQEAYDDLASLKSQMPSAPSQSGSHVDVKSSNTPMTNLLDTSGLGVLETSLARQYSG
jgi:tetratricopeptide (TPR) repeat protein